MFRLIPAFPGQFPEELSTQAQAQVGTGCYLVIANHQGRGVCLGSIAWPRWGLPGQLSHPQIQPRAEAQGHASPGCETGTARSTGQLLASHAQPALCSEGSEQKTGEVRAKAFVHVTFAWCPWRRALWGPGLTLGRQSLPKSGVGRQERPSEGCCPLAWSLIR